MTIYAFGSNGHGQLGLGHENDVSVPEECLFTVPPNESPLHIAAGGNVTVLLSKDGEIFYSGNISVGTNEKYQVLNEPRHRFEPVAIQSSHKAKLCSASWEAFFLVTEVNEIFVCGIGSKGELGLGHDSVQTGELVLMNNFPPEGSEIVDISSSVSHTVAVLSNGEVFGWGNGRKGQLGLPCAIVWEPRRVENVGFSVRGVASGRDFSVLVGDTSTGEVKVIGSDKWSVRANTPHNLSSWVHIGATWGGVVVLLDRGRLKTWGRNDRGQLGLPEASRLTHVVAGSEHTLRLTDQGILTCHGWGEHGNCGPTVDENGNAAAHPEPIELPNSLSGRRIGGLGAGCATSFFWTAD